MICIHLPCVNGAEEELRERSYIVLPLCDNGLL